MIDYVVDDPNNCIFLPFEILCWVAIEAVIHKEKRKVLKNNNKLINLNLNVFHLARTNICSRINNFVLTLLNLFFLHSKFIFD